mgnify:CR=1 FL=1
MTKTSVPFHQQDMLFLTNHKGEESERGRIPKQAFYWYCSVPVSSNWLHFLGKYNEEIGLMAFLNVSSSKIEELAEKLQKKCKFQVVTKQNEIGIWFPLGTKNDIIQKTIAKLK